MTQAAAGAVDLRGQVALVTGASSGLGHRFAQVLAQAGAKVAVAARRADRLDGLVREIAAAGGTAMAFPLDVADAAACPAVVETIEAALGPITILVNNAASGLLRASVDMTVEEMDMVYATNIRGPYLLSREVGKRLIASGTPGRIVNISSVGALHFDGAVPATFYCTTKSAVIRLTEALAMEWKAHQINVNAIAPGFFFTEMQQAFASPEVLDAITQSFARKRMGMPEQLDSTLLYLVAPASEMVTGITIRVDDGQTSR